MITGQDFTGITVSYIVYSPGKGFLASLRSGECRDEHFKWDLGGGGLTFNEKLEDAVKREIKEELNLDLDNLYFLGHRELFRKSEGEPTHWISFQYITIINDISRIKNLEPHKHTELRFFPGDALPPFNDAHSQLYPMLRKFQPEIERITGTILVLDN